MHSQRKQRVGMSVGRSVGRSVGEQVRSAMQLSRRSKHQRLAEKMTQRTGIFARSTRLRQHGRSHYSSPLITAIRSSSTRIISCAFRAQVRIKRCSCAAVQLAHNLHRAATSSSSHTSRTGHLIVIIFSAVFGASLAADCSGSSSCTGPCTCQARLATPFAPHIATAPSYARRFIQVRA